MQESLVKTLQDEIENLREQEQAKATLLSAAGHEIANNLHVASGYLTLISSENLSEKGHEYLARSEKAILAAQVVVMNEILGIRHDPPPGFEIQAINLAVLIQGAVESLHQAAESKSIKIDHDLADVTVSAAQRPLLAAIQNVVQNAIKFTPEGGWVRISSQVIDDRAIVRIADNGIGISKEVQEAIFAQFEAPRSSGSKLMATRLGLMITHKAIQQCGGEFSLTSQPGEGTTVTIALPLAKTPQ